MEWLNLYLFHRNDRVRRIKRNSKTAVNYFQQRRWRLVTLLEQFSGFWPYQSRSKNYPLWLFHVFLLLIGLSAMANKLREQVGVDPDMTIECCCFMLLVLGVFFKLLFASIYQSSRRKIYRRIANHFETISDPEEAAVLNGRAELGFKYALVYICGIMLLSGIFNGIPVIQASYQYFSNHRNIKMQIPLPMNFGFDHKYWYIIAVDFAASICSVVITDFAYDLSFILQVRHVSALFKIVRIRLRKASEIVDEFENKNENMSDEAADESYSLLSSAVDLHVKCFDLVKQIEECYTVNWFIILLLSTGGFGAGLYLVSTKLHDPIEAIRYIAAFIMLFSHFQVIFSQGQVIIDSSSTISNACYECKWYRLPKKSRKLLLAMMMRTSIPCQLTGAKLFPLSMETFSKMLKAGLSYYTVFETKRT